MKHLESIEVTDGHVEVRDPLKFGAATLPSQYDDLDLRRLPIMGLAQSGCHHVRLGERERGAACPYPYHPCHLAPCYRQWPEPSSPHGL